MSRRTMAWGLFLWGAFVAIVTTWYLYTHQPKCPDGMVYDYHSNICVIGVRPS